MSENAKAVANKVTQRVRKGQKVVLGEIIRESGYSDSVSESPTKVTKTKSYTKAIKPLADKLRNEVNRIASELESKDLSKERYVDLTNSLDKLNKNLQLLEGKPTEITKYKLSKEEQEKIDSLLDN